MTVNASVFIATSLDGFIARENGGIDWLPTPDLEDGEDYGYNAFIETVDAMVMGRNTYELVLAFDEWYYGELPVFVLSSRGVDIPGRISKTVSTMSGEPEEIVRHLGEQGFRHLYVDGGKTIQGFLKAGLISQLTITRIPVLIGSGIPLFGPLSNDIQLEHVESRTFTDGLVQNRYEVK